MPCYRLYGIDLESKIVFPGLPQSAAPPTAYLRTDSTPPGLSGTTFWFGHTLMGVAPAECWFVYHPRVGVIRIRKGSEVLMAPGHWRQPGPMMVRQLIGLGIAMMLIQQGVLLLHGTAVLIGGKAVVFLGRSGLGKSTLAAALLSRGHRLLSDRFVAVETKGPTPVVRSGLPHVSVPLSSLPVLVGRPPVDLFRVGASDFKTTVDVSDQFCASSVSLDSIFMLERGDTGWSAQVSGEAALFSLLKNGYLTSAQVLINSDMTLLSRRLVGRVAIRRLLLRGGGDVQEQAGMVEACIGGGGIRTCKGQIVGI